MQIHELESQFLENYDYIIGIDEAGRGPWAGPVTVGAVMVNSDMLKTLADEEFLNDSKKLSHKKRAVLEDGIIKNVFKYFVSDIDVETIDRINILEATKLGVLNCLEALIQEQETEQIPDQVSHGDGFHTWDDKRSKIKSVGILIDGKFNDIQKLISQLACFQNIKFEVTTVIDGDALCPSISAASILAKEHRDNLMIDLHKKYPEYGFDQHKGYGTKLHAERLSIFGPADIHRKSFAPIRKLMNLG